MANEIQVFSNPQFGEIRTLADYANILWPLFKEELLKGDAWLVRADQKDYSRLTEGERRFFEKGGSL